MADIQTFLSALESQLPLLTAVLIALILITLFNFFVGIIKKALLSKAKSKKQISNIKILARMLNVSFSILIILFTFFSYIGSWTGLGIFAGLITAVLGFALQKPITGIVAWIMIILKRPFSIGDRISINNIKGEVYDISLTHIYIDEVGGLVDAEEPSGRHVMVPNYLLFENPIINYTLLNEYVMGEVPVEIKYGSNLDKALALAKKSALSHIKEHEKLSKKDVQIRISFKERGIRLLIRFFAPVKMMQPLITEITKEVYDSFRKQKDIEFAHA